MRAVIPTGRVAAFWLWQTTLFNVVCVWVRFPSNSSPFKPNQFLKPALRTQSFTLVEHPVLGFAGSFDLLYTVRQYGYLSDLRRRDEFLTYAVGGLSLAADSLFVAWGRSPSKGGRPRFGVWHSTFFTTFMWVRFPPIAYANPSLFHQLLHGMYLIFENFPLPIRIHSMSYFTKLLLRFNIGNER